MNRRVLAAFGIALGLLIALLLVGIAWTGSIADRRWTLLETEALARIAEAKSRDPRRPVLRGTATPGNAWDDYSPAVAAMKSIDFIPLNAYVDRLPKAEPDKARAVVDANLRALDQLRAGASREQGAFPIDWSRGFEAPLPPMFAAQTLVNLALARGRFLAAEGRSGEARDSILDGLQFAADVGRHSVMIMGLTSSGLLQKSFLELRALPPDPAVARALSTLDAAWPDPGETLRNEATMLAGSLRMLLENPAGVGQKPFPFLESWRYGFSTRLMLADAARVHMDSSRLGVEALQQSWAEFRRVSAELERSRSDSRNPALSLLAPTFGGTVRILFERRAQLRLLRRYHGETAELDDPFGGKIRDDGRKIWSAGPDGVDDGGRGAWKAPDSGDLVLERP